MPVSPSSTRPSWRSYPAHGRGHRSVGGDGDGLQLAGRHPLRLPQPQARGRHVARPVRTVARVRGRRDRPGRRRLGFDDLALDPSRAPGGRRWRSAGAATGWVDSADADPAMCSPPRANGVRRARAVLPFADKTSRQQHLADPWGLVLSMKKVCSSRCAVALADDGRDGDEARERLSGEQLAAPELVDLEVASVLRRRLVGGHLDLRRAARPDRSGRPPPPAGTSSRASEAMLGA